jgi:hypothetical protein
MGDAIRAYITDTQTGIDLGDLSDVTIASGAQGDVLYRDGTGWVNLPAGTSGHFLQTNGAGADPEWAAAGGGWQDDGTVVRLVTTTDKVVIGNTTYAGGAALSVEKSSSSEVLAVRNTTDGAGNQLCLFIGNQRATAADGDEAYFSFQLDCDHGLTEMARITWEANDVTDTTEDGELRFAVMVAGTLTTHLTLNETGAAFDVGGVTIGSPTGGNKGAGTINAAGDIYKNNSAYNNPKWALQRYFTGHCNDSGPYAAPEGYSGLLEIDVHRNVARANNELPLMLLKPHGGLFDRGDLLLASLEEAYLYIYELHDRIRRLEESCQIR